MAAKRNAPKPKPFTRSETPAKKVTRRKIRISVTLPATVEAIVCFTSDPDEESDRDWTIDSITNISCEASVRTVNENMSDDDFDALVKAAEAAEDVKS